MTRPLLPTQALAPEAVQALAAFHPDVIREVSQAVSQNKVVVVGMAQNPFVKKARQALKNAGVEFTYLEYGSYLSSWKQRLAIKLWSGWPTFPQVFVAGTLIGGANDTIKAIANGSLQKRLQDKK